jgi:MFS family permease
MNTIDRLVRVSKDFLRRQKHNYRVAMGRSAASNLLVSLTSQYNAIYATGLGADAVQLGSLSSIGSALSALISAPVGWLMDRRGIKRFYLLAIALSAGGALLYALSNDWRILVIAAILASISTRLSSTGCSVICADSVQNQERATAQNVCGTLTAIVAATSPLIAAYLVSLFGGITVEGIRPLYYIQFVGYGLIFAFVAAQLREPKQNLTVIGKARFGFLSDFRDLFRERGDLWKWIGLVSLTGLPMAMF